VATGDRRCAAVLPGAIAGWIGSRIEDSGGVHPGISGYLRSLAVSPAYNDDHTLFAGTSRGVHAYAIDDRSAPVSVITAPAAGARMSDPLIVIEGTASDGSGVGVARVEVSTDNGSAWHDALDGGGIRRFATWSHSFSQPAAGDHQLRSRATDQLGKVEIRAAFNGDGEHAAAPEALPTGVAVP
jgi:hypothetical protein